MRKPKCIAKTLKKSYQKEIYCKIISCQKEISKIIFSKQPKNGEKQKELKNVSTALKNHKIKIRDYKITQVLDSPV